jgi:hypothetical protein
MALIPWREIYLASGSGLRRAKDRKCFDTWEKTQARFRPPFSDENHGRRVQSEINPAQRWGAGRPIGFEPPLISQRSLVRLLKVEFTYLSSSCASQNDGN